MVTYETFKERTGSTISHDQFRDLIIPMAVYSSLTDEQFCDEYKKYGDSPLVLGLAKYAIICTNANNYIRRKSEAVAKQLDEVAKAMVAL